MVDVAERARARLDDLVSDSDVLLWTGRPDEMPFAYDHLAELNPGLVLAVLSPKSQTYVKGAEPVELFVNVTVLGAVPVPGSAVKLGKPESATFIRKVPEPQRQLRMRRRTSVESAPSATMLV